ncbi:MAG: N-acetyl sugar amidotransferase [Betaproteobacteria bacterium]|jgi:N-acetyl sugar amidotransferase|nr:N-acetyl sugar amidotransferase [Betaproteobacteria bacterium]
MALIKYPELVDFSQYGQDLKSPSRYYGLPEKIHFCSRCAYSNQKPNSEKEYKHKIDTKKPTVEFDKDGVCAACRVAETKKSVDWSERESMLRELCDRYRRSDGHYDCLVPGSGGKDSFFAAHKLKYEYGMNPLTVTWAPHIYTDWGWQNFQAWIHAGFDNYLFTPNGRVHRLLTRLAVERLFHPFQPFIMGQMYFPPKMAAKFGIPLVFYGENPTEYGNNRKENATAKKDASYFTTADRDDLYVAGTSVDELKDKFGLNEVDLDPYLPMRREEIDGFNINVQYLGYYMPWHPQDCYYYAVEHGGFRAAPERTAGTYSKYSSIDDKIDDLHYLTTFIKFGIGRATYDSSQEVRNGDISREEAVALIRRYDGEYPERFEDANFNYLSLPADEFPVAHKHFEKPTMDREYFSRLTDNFRSPHLWRHDETGWHLRRAVYDE